MSRNAYQLCPGCGIWSITWDNEGQGFILNGKRYCCEACADGAFCACGECLVPLVDSTASAA